MDEIEIVAKNRNCSKNKKISLYPFFQKFDVHGSQDAESALLEHVNAIPNGNIVLMAVYDSANPCNTDCRESLDLVGGIQQRIGLRGWRTHLNSASKFDTCVAKNQVQKLGYPSVIIHTSESISLQ